STHRIGGGCLMSKRTHPMFLELAVRQFALPETLMEIKQELRREQEWNDSLSLEIAHREGMHAEKNDPVLKELNRQKEQSDKRIEALNLERSRLAVYEAVKEAQPTELLEVEEHAAPDQPQSNNVLTNGEGTGAHVSNWQDIAIVFLSDHQLQV